MTMEFRRYDNAEVFRADVLDNLLKNEILNNLAISILTESKARNTSDWLMAAVVDGGEVSHAALNAKPFNLLLYEADSHRRDGMELLAKEIKRLSADPPCVFAERGLARRFADAYASNHAAAPERSMVVMRLDELADYKKAPGYCRELTVRDLYFAPFWERSFGEECRTQVFPIPDIVGRVSSRLGKGTHFVWEDGIPVSQAVHGRSTPCGAVINMVYTPPHYRGRGYATSVVAKLSGLLLDGGKDFCCLFADSGNPVAQEIYRKLGYYDVYTFDIVQFDTAPQKS